MYNCWFGGGVYSIQNKEKIFTKKEFFRERESGGLNKKKTKKKGFLTALATAIKDPTTSIRKHANECLEIMLDARSREVWRNKLVKVEESEEID